MEEASKVLMDLPKGKLLVALDKRGESYIVPMEMLRLLMGDDFVLENVRSGSTSVRLLPAEYLAIAGTTPGHTTPFETKGYRDIMVMILNPVWVTNPTDMLATWTFTDNDTTFYNIMNVDSADMTQICLCGDGDTSVFFLRSDSTGHNMPPIPSHDSRYKLRLTFTPAGSAESKNIEVTVFGVR